MKKIKKHKKKIILLISFIFGGIIGVSASMQGIIFDSNEVAYDNSNSSLTSTDVQSALDELGTKASLCMYYSNQIEAPVYRENVQGEVYIIYPQGCNALTCQYSTNGGSTWTTVTSNPTVYIGTNNGTVIARVTKDTKTVTAPTYTVQRNALYVSSSGNDSTGYGTINKPYATISKAYTSGASTSTIYAMNNISPTTYTRMNSNKNITLTSCTKSGSGETATCPTSSANTITKSSSYTDNTTYNYMLYLESGALTLRTIKLDGSNTNFNGGAILGKVGSTINLLTGTTIQNFKATASNGAAVRLDDASSASTTNGLLVNGATIQNNASTEHSAGAIYVSVNRSATIQSGTISGNTAINGGGIYTDTGGTLNVEGGTISSNTATNCGGGISIRDNTDLTITGGTITQNTAISGGGIDAIGDIIISGGSITNNTATGTASNNGYGGGIYTFGNISMDDGEITDNKATNYGGGIAILKHSSYPVPTATLTGGIISDNILNGSTTGSSGGGIYSNNSNLAISEVEINGNTSAKGGGIFIVDGTSTISNSNTTINENITTNVGGGIYLSSGSLTISGGHINNNTSLDAGGIYTRSTLNINGSSIVEIKGNTANPRAGGGIFVGGGTTTASNNNLTIENNTANTSGGGVHIQTGTFVLSGGTIKKNTANTSGGIYKASGGTYTRNSGYVCKNNSPTNSYDITATTDSHCS